LRIVQQLGASFGVATLALALQRGLTAALGDPVATAAAFGDTFWWTFALTMLALIPAALLLRAKTTAGARMTVADKNRTN
jgi:hypothetical protein